MEALDLRVLPLLLLSVHSVLPVEGLVQLNRLFIGRTGNWFSLEWLLLQDWSHQRAGASILPFFTRRPLFSIRGDSTKLWRYKAAHRWLKGPPRKRRERWTREVSQFLALAPLSPLLIIINNRRKECL